MSTPVYHGTILYPRRSGLAWLIYPLVQLKRLFQSLYTLLLRIMWRELWSGEVPQSDGVKLGVILLFGGLCWVSFVFQRASQGIFVALLLAWLVDTTLSQQALRQGKYIQAVHLTLTPQGTLQWQWDRPGHKVLRAEFTPEQVRWIRVQRRIIRGGAFQSGLAQVWQAQLVLYDESDWVIEEDCQLNRVLEAIARLRPYLDDGVPVAFDQSYGWAPYDRMALWPGSTQLELPGLAESSPILAPGMRKAHLFSRWQWRDSWQLVRQIGQESGFLLFVILMMGFMTQIGGILEQIRQGFGGRDIILELTWPSRWPWQDWRLVVPVLGAIAVMVYQGWQLSRVKHCFVDSHFVRAKRDNQTLGKLPTPSIHSVLALDGPAPGVLLLNNEDSLLIPHFPHLSAALHYSYQLAQAIATVAETDPPPEPPLS